MRAIALGFRHRNAMARHDASERIAAKICQSKQNILWAFMRFI
jgi:hypothetical protein